MAENARRPSQAARLLGGSSGTPTANATLPYGRPAYPEFRRLYYVRYADDFLLEFAGPRAEAETIKGQLGTVLQESFKLTLSEAKTVITHAWTEAAHVLGYDIVVVHDDQNHDQFGHPIAEYRGIVAYTA
jgi:hypothetical protein